MPARGHLSRVLCVVVFAAACNHAPASLTARPGPSATPPPSAMSICQTSLPGMSVVRAIAVTTGDIRHSRIDAIVFAQPWLEAWPGVGDSAAGAWCAVRLGPRHFKTFATTQGPGHRAVQIVESTGATSPDIPNAITPDHDPRLAYTPRG